MHRRSAPNITWHASLLRCAFTAAATTKGSLNIIDESALPALGPLGGHGQQ